MKPDTTVKKVSSEASPSGDMGQVYLVSGKRLSMRLWRNEGPQSKGATRRDYETVGYVIAGRAEVTVEGQTLKLEAGEGSASVGNPIAADSAHPSRAVFFCGDRFIRIPLRL